MSKTKPGGKRQALSRRKRLPRLPEDHATVRDVRQMLGTGTVADVAALQPPRPSTDHINLDIPEEVITRLPDRAVEAAYAFVAKTGIAQFVDDAYAQSKQKAGAPAKISTNTVLVAMRLATRDSRPLLVTELRDILYRRLSTPMRRLLDIPDDPYPTDADDIRMWRARTVSQVGRALHRMLAPIDPSVMPKNRILPAQDVAGLRKDLSIAEQQARATALDWVTGQLLDAAYQQLPQQVRDRHEQKTTAYCIDGTPLSLFARGRGLDSQYISTDPDGGWYKRDGDHRDADDVTTVNPNPKDSKDPKKPITRRQKKIWGREVHLLVTADASHPKRLYMPAIPIAATTDRPGVDPAGAARRVFANMKARGHRPGPLAGDILYTNQDEAKFQTPAREAGYDLVLGYGVTQTGAQGAHKSGMTLIDGTYFAPCLPDDLIDIVADLRTKKITQKEFATKVKARAEFRMRTKQTADPATGARERLSCPAAGPSPVAICGLKPKSSTPRPTRQPDGAVVDVRRKINYKKVLTNGTAPTVCQQEAVSLAPTDGAKYRQNRLYGTPEHSEIYYRLRQSQEGVHGTAKDEATIALANAGRRRVRGWAAQQVFAAFLLAETTTRRILTFLSNAKTDPNGDLYVDRREVVDTTGSPDHPTSGSPPGAPPVINADEAA